MPSHIKHIRSPQHDRASQETLASIIRYSSNVLRSVARENFYATKEGQTLSSEFAKADAEERMPELVSRSVELAEKDNFYHLERFCQRYVAEEVMNNRIVFSEAAREEVLAQLDAPKNSPGGTCVLDENLEMPEYFEGVEYHLQPGGFDGYDLYAAPSAGPPVFVYKHGGFAAVPPESNMFHHRTLVAQQLRKDSYKRIMEIGCGPGATLHRIHDVYPEAELVGVDLSRALLVTGHDYLERLGIKADLRQEDCRFTTEADGSFDGLVSYAVHHEAPFEANIEMFKEAFRILEPGGDMVIHDPPPFRAVDPFHAAILDWDTEHREEPYFSEASYSNWDKELTKIGFVDVESYSLGENSYPWITRGTKPPP